MEAQTNRSELWLRLDNAAKIYPAVKDNELTAVFRVSVQLKTSVRIKAFLEAVKEMEERFPYYKAKLKAGFFWYYLEPHRLPIAVEPDIEVPCRSFKPGDLMFRVLVKDNTISVEFSHILTDGTGALEFLKTLLTGYLKHCGLPISADVPALKAGEVPLKEEYEDAYHRYFKKVKAPPPNIGRAFHVPFRLRNTPRFKILTAIIPIADIIQQAKQHNASLTEYLTAVYLYSLQMVYNQLSGLRKKAVRKVIRIEVPVNLRRMFPSRTMRNFSLYVMPGIDLRLGHYSFEEIIKIVYHQMQLETDPKLISKMISRNVSGEKNAFIRAVPLLLKSLILAKLYAQGTSQYSGVVTNLGRIDLGPEINSQVQQFLFVPPPPNKILKVNCGMVGFDGKLVLTFGNITRSNELERQFFTFLTARGVPVKIITHKK